MTRTARTGRVAIWLLIVLVVAGIAAGFSAGVFLGKREFGGAAKATSTAAAEEQWYTCGMHPQVRHKGPGTCPICGMKLTPVKQAAGGQAPTTQGGPKERKILYWRAPMDPNYISDKPGKSPMGMDLVPVYAEEAVPEVHAIVIDPVTIQNMGIRTARLKRGPLIKTIRTVGRVAYDEQTVTFVTTKFEGWIEKLFVDETGQHVNKDQPLFDVYSRELWQSQSALLASLRNLSTLSGATFTPAREDARLQLEADRMRLRNYDVSEAQIQKLEETKEIQKALTIDSPAEGIVTEKKALEGMYVKPGMQLYTIADLSKVWVYVDVYEYQLPWIRVGQEATMTLPYIPGKKYLGKIVYIYPYLQERTRVVHVRLEFENPNLELKPEMYATVVVQSELEHDALLIPREGYIDTGVRQVAFEYLGDGKFQPRDIQVGVQAENGMVEVLGGLDEGQIVVTSGQFLLDADSRLKEAAAKMMEPNEAVFERSPTTAPATQEHTH